MKSAVSRAVVGVIVMFALLSIAVGGQTPRFNRQPGLEGGEPVEQPRPSLADHRKQAHPPQGWANPLHREIQPGIILNQSPTEHGILGQPLGQPSRAKWPHIWDECSDAFFGYKDRRVLREMERNGETIFLNSLDGPRFLPQGRIHAAGPPVFSGIYSNAPKIDSAVGLLWFECMGNSPFAVRYQRCDAQGRPVGQPQISELTTADEVLWPIPELTGCMSPGEGQLPICGGPPIWFAVGDRIRFVCENRLIFSISLGTRKIATVGSTNGGYYQYFQ